MKTTQVNTHMTKFWFMQLATNHQRRAAHIQYKVCMVAEAASGKDYA